MGFSGKQCCRWAHCASTRRILRCFQNGHFGRISSTLHFTMFQSLGGLLPSACRTSRASARRIVSCRGVCVSSLSSQIPLAPALTFSWLPQQSPQQLWGIQAWGPVDGRGNRNLWETHLLPLLVLTSQGRSTGKNQYW